MGKMLDGTMKRSEESITRMTSYRFPHHDSRSFTFVQPDALPSYTRTMDSAAERSSLAHAVRLRVIGQNVLVVNPKNKQEMNRIYVILTTQ